MTPYFERDGVSLFQGDALDILPTLRAQSADLVVTDPPYVIGAVSAGNMASKSGGWGDMMNSARWFRDWYLMTKRILKPTGAMWTFCNWRSLPVVMRAALDADWPIASVLVWDKEWIGPGGPVGLRPSYELVVLLPMPEFQIPDRGVPDIWRYKWASYKPTGHAAEKPVALMSRLIRESGLQSGALVVDPFVGSGTTLRAAMDCGCRGIGIETEDRNCEMVVGRLGQQVLFAEVPA